MKESISSNGTVQLTPAQLAQYIDHTLLKPDATAVQISALCSEALNFKFAAVCVNGAHVELAASLLKGSSVKVASVVGFPFGAMTTSVKAFEAERAVRDGAKEIDMVMRIDLAHTGEFKKITQDVLEVVRAVESNAIVKVILETGLLQDQEIVASAKAAEQAGAHFIKTCTGYAGAGKSDATIEHIRLMRAAVSSSVSIKASGGIRTIEKAIALIHAGASRLGTSSGVAIMSGANAGETY